MRDKEPAYLLPIGFLKRLSDALKVKDIAAGAGDITPSNGPISLLQGLDQPMDGLWIRVQMQIELAQGFFSRMLVVWKPDYSREVDFASFVDNLSQATIIVENSAIFSQGADLFSEGEIGWLLRSPKKRWNSNRVVLFCSSSNSWRIFNMSVSVK
jgi:hypothetical protein